MRDGERSARILVTNDDGVRAEGLAALADAMRAAFSRVTVVAPDREQSAVSHALTISRPLRVERLDEAVYAVQGTPTDCVNLAFFHILDAPPDLVVSGINDGFNLGEDVTYSGTVAGALEGRILGAPSLAVSTEAGADADALRDVADEAVRLARAVLRHGLPADAFLNVNVPIGARGRAVTRQGRRDYRKADGLVVRRDPKGRDYFWIGLAPSAWHSDPHADHAAVASGVVSITPLHSDLTFHRAIPAIEEWLSETSDP